jgi:hypothetical protein
MKKEGWFLISINGKIPVIVDCLNGAFALFGT